MPSAKTDSAKAARSAFYCDLCQKGYSRMNEFEAHESSYDHQHRKRLKDMKEMQRQVQTSGRKEEKGPLMSIKLGAGSSKSSGGGGGFKKGGFKNAFAPVGADEDVKKEDDNVDDALLKKSGSVLDEKQIEEEDSDVTDQEDYYDPRKPTGCMPGCGGSAIVANS